MLFLQNSDFLFPLFFAVTYELANSLVHLTERLSVPKPANDPHFNVMVHAAKLKRVVEMYQWVETEHRREVTSENGDTVTEYSYDYTQVRTFTMTSCVRNRFPDDVNIEVDV